MGRVDGIGVLDLDLDLDLDTVLMSLALNFILSLWQTFQK